MSAPNNPVDLALAPGSVLKWDGDSGSQKVIIEDVLGKGGFGITYKARTRRYGLIALKEFFPRSMIVGRKGDEIQINQDKMKLFNECKRQFIKEARILQTLSSPYIVKVLFTMSQNNTVYYGMELLEGEDLDDYMERLGRPLEPAEAYNLLHPILQALMYLHSNKVLHRDISPDNIFLHREGDRVVPCLVDFGAAFSAQQDFTHTFPRVKKRGYSPLEQNWEDEHQGTWSDVYSLAATFYYTLTLKNPIPAEERGTEEHDALKKPHELNPMVSEKVEKVLLHGLALDYEKRIYNMIEMDKELARAFNIAVQEPKAEPVKEYSSEPPLTIIDRKPITMDRQPGTENRRWDDGDDGGTGASETYVPPAKGGLHNIISSFLEELSKLKQGNKPVEREREVRENAVEKNNRPEDDYPESSGIRHNRLICYEGYREGQTILLDGDRVSIGRKPDCDLSFPDEYRTVSGKHCILFKKNGEWKIVDTNSKNGTYLNGKQLDPNVESPVLKPGDRISFASEVYIFQ